MNKPMTTEELFNKIYDILKEKGKIPDILEYGHASGSPAAITTYEYELGSKLAYGGNEGIYLDIWIEYSANNKKQRIGIFKTLHESNDAMHAMARLLADFIIEEHIYVNEHLDDFTWEGVDVYAFDEKGKRCGCTCWDMEAALHRKDELLKKYPRVIVRENATRKEKIFNESKGVLAMKRLDYRTAQFEKVGICSIECEFNDMRIDRNTVPAGKYQYEIAGDDDCGDEPVRVSQGVIVNFFGTLISSQPLPIGKDGTLWLKGGDFAWL